MDDFIRAEQRAREAADSGVTSEQAELKPGDFFIRHAHGVVIYGEILDAAALGLGDRKVEDLDEEEREEYECIVAEYNAPHMQNYRFTRSFSQFCPQGELGDIHVSTVTRKISREEFLSAQDDGWA